MQILAISDTHNDIPALQQVLALHAHAVDMVLHLGDHGCDLAKAAAGGNTTPPPMYAVAGNCDAPAEGPPERVLQLPNGTRLLMLHGHRHGVKRDYQRLVYYAQEKGAGLCLFGHTHQAVTFTHEAVLFVNPGSLGHPPEGTRPSYALVTVDATVSAEVFYL